MNDESDVSKKEFLCHKWHANSIGIVWAWHTVKKVLRSLVFWLTW